MVSRSQLESRFKLEFLSTLTGTISGAILVFVLARLLDPDMYGLLYLTLSVIGIGKVFAKLGLSKSAARYITEYKESDPGQLAHIIKFSGFLSMILMLIVTIVIGIGSKQIANLINEPDVAPLLIVGCLFVFFTTLFGFLRRVLQGFEAIKQAAVLSIIKSVGKFVFAVGLAVAGFGAVGVLTGYVLSSLIASIISLYVVYFRHYRPLDHNVSMKSDLRRRIVEYSIPLTASEAAGTLSSRIDTILVGFFLNPIAVSYYTIANQIIKMTTTPVSALGFTLAPTFGAQKSDGNSNTAARIFEESFVHVILLYLPASVGLIILAEPLINLIFGQEYAGAVSVLRVFGPVAIVQANLHISAKGLDFLGRARTRAIVKTATSTLNFGLNIVLIPTIGVVGAAIATVITSSLYALSNMYIIHDELHLNMEKLTKETIKIVVITLVMALIVFSMKRYITNLLTLILIAVSGALICLSLSVILNIIDVDDISGLY